MKPIPPRPRFSSSSSNLNSHNSDSRTKDEGRGRERNAEDQDGGSELRVVLITGAAGGLGRGLVSAFAGRGWQVVAACHRITPPWPGERIWTVPLDVTDRQAVEETTKSILDRFGRVDVLVNNAGMTMDQPVWQLDEAAWQSVIDVNLTGAFLCSQAVLPAMQRAGGGHIINLTSQVGRRGVRGQASYAASKAGLMGLTQSLAREEGCHNIQVNAVMPGVLPSGMTAPLAKDQRRALIQANVLGRANTLEEVAGFVAFLARMQGVSGQCFQLDSRIGSWLG
jgi:3-oxoacyl-[acyl-carrier protein] reductase